MSIVVTANADGSFTVTCDKHSLTFGGPASSTTAAAPAPPAAKTGPRAKSSPPDPAVEPFAIPTSGTLGGVTAQICPDADRKRKRDAFHTIEAFEQALHEGARLPDLGPSDPTVRFLLKRGSAIDFSALERVSLRAGLERSPKVEIFPEDGGIL